MQRRIVLKRAGGMALSATLVPAALAQSDKTAFIISGFPAGGMGDQVARPMAEKLRGSYASSVVADSRVGAGGRIAVDFVRRAQADGMTILQIPSSPMTLYPNTYRKLSYDPPADFIPVTSTVKYSFVFTAGPGVPPEVKSIADYIKWVQAHPKEANYGVPAAGSALHFVGMLLDKHIGQRLTAVPYKGGAPLLNDVLGGQVPVSVSVLGEVMPYIRNGRLRGLAVSSPERSPFLPGVPTFSEQGFRDIVVQEWLGWFLPAKSPQERVQLLNKLVRDGLQDPALVESLAKNGLQPFHQSPEEFAQLMRGDLARWTPIVKASGFTAED
ncbi:MAG: tripartite tricarboxylate transporter substrate-binding protein [Ottowia sp.]|uniref:tripartite tricarboxylate transporter substrate-binding protein n=1 Tax=Ottowia sp. TaxID=1898956 RepID=UPI003C72F988